MKIIISLVAVILVVSLVGCEENFFTSDMTPPSMPSGLYSLAGDKYVELFWNPNTESDIAGYKVFAGLSVNGRYEFLGSIKSSSFIDDGIRNGTTYYYRITSYDYDGNESSLSREYTSATPRPEGYDIILKDYRTFPAEAGYDFSTYSVGQYDDQYTDIFFEYYSGIYYMDVWDDSEIQDFGYTKSLSEINEAPTSGWSPTKDVRLIVGHTYIARTWDYHYAKIRIISLSSTRVIFDWAYQLQSNNTQLKIGNSGERKSLHSGSGLTSR